MRMTSRRRPVIVNTGRVCGRIDNDGKVYIWTVRIMLMDRGEILVLFLLCSRDCWNNKNGK
jgi:hypothetical protein